MIDAFLDWLVDLLIEIGGRITVWFLKLPADETSWGEL